MSDSKRIALLGTGIMGSRMTKRLLAAGHNVTVWNRSFDKTAPLAELGAKVAKTPAAAAKDAELVILMLSDGPSCQSVLFGAEGVAAALQPAAIVIDMSSIPPPMARDHAQKLAAL
jgi:2-hydroxy-3-oxopropionate reductase